MDGDGGSGGGTLSEIYQSARRLLLRARDGSRGSNASNPPPSPPPPHRRPRSGRRRFARARLRHQEGYRPDPVTLRRDGSPLAIRRRQGQRDLWKRKLEQLVEEVDSLKESLDKHLMRQQKRMVEAKERAELLERANGDSSHVLRIFDEEAQAMQSARNSSIMLEEAYATGVAILSKYADQRDRLKRAQRKALDILNTVGLSNSVLKLIERRHRVDKWIAYAGMIITIVVVYAFWRGTH
uniref:Membrin n=1 Tax=Ananas comosus var. bracteatus TaxID=296719 RepID=A0A6V7NXL6_ANACO|nr:unnamed protein product [Ananas comosus var. bracteatus]